ncbi:MAG: TlpA disulfide reductase family protein [Flavobacteriales bacterium]
MRKLIFAIWLTLFSCNLSFAQQGAYYPFVAEIQLNDRLQIQVTASLPKLDANTPITIKNGKEVYQLSVKKRISDTIVYQFPGQDAEWRIAFDKDFSDARGWWINYNKKVPVRYPIHLHSGFLELPAPEVNEANISGRWRVIFAPGTPNEETLVGVFEQEIGNFVSGSFLSETGDYRYLHGYISEGKFHLQTYTGYWAFMVDATLQNNDQMSGNFYSGASYNVPFTALRDAAVQLRDESSLTYLIKRDETVYLKGLTKLNGRKVNLDLNKQNQVTLIQIMGTWCPNCIDESQLLIDLQKEYGDNGLRVIGLAFEVGNNAKTQRARLTKFAKELGINYELYLAGTSSKEAAAAYFPMLNGIMSFPTSILVDSQGKVVAIHTGFSGPATGQAYIDLVQKFKQEIEGALSE